MIRNYKFKTQLTIMLTCFLMAFIVTNNKAQTVYSENFEGAWTLPATLSPAWSGTTTPADNVWHKTGFTTGWTSASGAYVTLGANATTASARFHTYDAAAGTTGELITPAIDLSSFTAGTVKLNFYHINTSGTDVLNVYVSDDNGATWSSALAPSPIGVSAAWTLKTISLPGNSATTVIKFTATSDFGTTDIGIDEVRVYLPVTPDAAPVTFLPTLVTQVGMTIGWTDNSTNETAFRLYRSTDNVTFTQQGTDIVSTSTATTGITYSQPQTGLLPATTYYYRIAAVSDLESPYLTGAQATLAGINYYWVGTSPADFNSAANWNTMADNTGTTRSTPTSTDILIVDGDGIAAGTAVTMTLAAAGTCGQLLITNNTAVTIQSTTTTVRTITINGGPGNDLELPAGCILNLTNVNPAAIAFSGTGNTGNISGTLNFAGAAGNNLTTTGGTGTLVTVSNTGIVNLGFASNLNLVGSVATLSFANGANCNSTGATTGAPPVPLATWGANSNLTISGITSSTTTATNNAQSFGNVTYNCPAATATMNFWGATSTAVIKGNLNISATNTGKFRATSSGTITINGNLNVSGGTFEVASTTGTVNVLGNVNLSGGTLDMTSGSSAATLKISGNFLQTAGTFALSGTSTTNSLEFNGTLAQTFTPLTVTATTLNVKINNAAGVSLAANLPIRNLTVTSGNLTGSGLLSYNAAASTLLYNSSTVAQTMTGTEFPSANGPLSLTINNTATTPNNTVSMPFSRSLAGTTGALNLTAGILDNSTYLFSISNTAVAAIVGGSASSYVKGAIDRKLPASYATASTYNFPVGKGAYNPFALVNPTTNSGGTVTVQAEVFDANCGGTPGNLIGTLNTNKYWAASATAGAANLTGSLIQLNDTPNGADAIAASSTLTGAYDLIGGLTTTVTSSSLTSTAPATVTLPGYFVMGNKAASALSNLAISPTGNQCTNITRTVTVTATPGGAAVTGVVINYSINGVAQPAIIMTNTIANDWSGVIPTVSPANATITWSVTATDANLLTTTATGTPYTDEPNFGVTATASANNTTVCSGSNTVLSIVVAPEPIIYSEGFETWPPTGWTFINAGLGNSWATSTVAQSGVKAMQYGFNSSNAANAWGITPGQNLTSGVTYTIKYWYNTAGGYTESLKLTVGSAATVGAQTTVLLTQAALTNTTYAQATATFTPSSSGTYYFGLNCYSIADQWNLYVDNFTITSSPSAYSWSDGSTVVGTTNPLTVNPTSNTNYTCTTTVSGCPLVSNTVAISTLTLPAAPTATNSTQCGTQMASASVASAAGVNGTGTFNWYAASTGGVALQSNTATTYGSTISTTTTFYVSESGVNGCESARTPLTVTVGAAPALTLSSGTLTICKGATSSAITVTSTLADFDSYTWNPSSAVTGSEIAGWTFNPTTTTTFTLTGTNSGSGCANTATVIVTVNELPVISAITTSVEPICEGNSTTLTAVSIPATTATATAGAGASTAITYDNPFYSNWSNTQEQILVKGSELTAAGLVAGNITSLGLVVTAGTTNMPDFALGIQNTSLNALSTLATSGFTNVYTNVTGITPIIGTNTITFSTPFNWDGSSNLLLKFCWGNNGTTATQSNTVKADATSYVCSVNAHNTSATSGSSICSGSTVYSTYSKRPQFIFGGQVGNNLTSTLNWSWSPATGLSGTTTNSVTASPTVTTLYTVTATDPGTTCSSNQTVNVTVNPKPTAPVSGNITQCGTITPTPPVNYITELNGYTTPTYNWYSAASGGTLLLSTTDKTVSPALVLGVNTFYVTVINPTTGCESNRTTVTITVNTPPAFTLSSANTAICSGSSSSAITIASGAIDYNTYNWSPSSNVSGNSTSGWVFNPTTTTTYSLTALNTTSGCVTSATVAVNVNPLPSAVTIAPAGPLSVCNNKTQTLTASGGLFTNASILNENFNGATNSWTTINNSTGGTPANAAWTLKADGYVYAAYGSWHSNDSSQFYITNSDAQGAAGTTSTILVSPAFSTVGFSSANLTFYQFLYFPSSATVEYSVNGTTWTVLQSYFTSQGSAGAFAPANLVLPAGALNQASVKIRFKYDESFGYFWGIDNVSISGTQQQAITWSPVANLYSDAATTISYTGATASTVYFKSSTAGGPLTYTATATSALSCTSSATVNITVMPAVTKSQTITVCSGGSVTVGGTTHTTTGTFIDVITGGAATGCDSTVTTNLTVLQAIASTQTLTVCAGASVTVGGTTHTTTGTYTDIITGGAVAGCDSTVTTNLTVRPAVTGSQTLTLCAGGSIIVGGNTHTTTGTYTDVITGGAATGCDSTVTTDLTIRPAVTSSQTLMLCAGGSITVGGTTHTTTGTFIDVITGGAASGCDSTVTTDLTVNLPVDVSTTVTANVITATNSTASYQWIDCDNGNAIISGQTGQSFTALVSGNYAVIVTEAGTCSDISTCVNVIVTGVTSTNSGQVITISPNPTMGVFTLNIENANSNEVILTILDVQGKVVYYESDQGIPAKYIKQIDLTDLSKGIYFVKMKIGSDSKVEKLIVQ